MNKEKKTTSFVSAFAISSILLTLLGVALRGVNLLNFYDSDIGYFKNAFLPTVMNIFFLLCVLAFAAMTFIIEFKRYAQDTLSCPVFFKAVSGVCSASLILLATYLVFNPNQNALFPYFILTCIASAVYFALLIPKNIPTANAIFALLPAVLCVFILAVTYFDVYTPMNAPHKVLIHLTCISSMLGFLAEARAIADKKKKKTYLFFVLSGLFFTGVSSIPSVILFFTDKFDYPYVIFDLIFLVFFIYFAARATTLVFGNKSTESTNEEQAEHTVNQ
jgi:hypothetical protein